MADVDSLSISLSADTSSAEESINKLIGRLALLKVAVQGASNFTKIAGGIAKIAEAARKIDDDSGKKLSNLARGLMDLSKVGDLSNLSTAGKNLSSIVKAVNGIGNTTGGGLGNLASEIERTGNALDSIKSADTSKLREIQDALSGETSGPLYTSSRQHESAELGGGSATYSTGGDMQPYGAMTVYTYVASSIRDATAAYQEFVAALGGGVPPIFTEFVNSARQAKDEVLQLTNAVRGLLTGGTNWTSGNNQDTFWRSNQTPLLSGAPNFTAGSSGLDLSRAIETEFVDAENRFADYTMRPLEAEMPRITLMPVDDGAAESVSNLTSAFSALGSVLGGVGTGLVSVGKVLFAIPKYFGGQLIGNIKQATKGFTGLFNSIKRIAKYRAIRAALRMITKHISEGIKNLYNWSKVADGTFAASMNKISTASHYMGNSFAAMVSPLINALAPAIDFIANKVVDLFNLINQLFARLTGQTSYTAAKKFTTQWDSASKSASGSAKKAADEIKRTLLGFDEINKLNDNNETSSGGGGGGGGGGTSAANMFETLPIDSEVASFADSLKAAFQAGDWQELGTLLGNKVNEIVESIDWAGYGAKVGYYINGWFETKYWTLDTINFTNIGAHIAEFLNNAIKEIKFDILGRSMVQKLGIIGDLVIGFFGEFDWGQAATKLSGFVRGLFDEIAKWLDKHDWTEIGTELADGLSDAVEGIDYKGIAKSLVKAFDAALVASISLLSGFFDELASKFKVAINWDEIPKSVQGVITAITSALGVGLLALGAVLAFSGAHVGLGIGLMAAGATALGTAASLNWNLSKLVKEHLDEIKTVVSAALLVLGAVLTFSGANIPLGLGLLAAGAVGLASTKEQVWSALYTTLSGWLDKYGVLVGGALLAVGALLAFTGANIPLGIGLLAAGAITMGTTISLKWTTLKTQLEGYIEQYGLVVSGALLAVGALLAFTGANIPLGIGIMAAGAVAMGASISLKWTTLKTQLEGYLEQYGLVVSGALLAVGALLSLTGANIPLGLGLLAAGAATMGATVSVTWSSLKNQLSSWLEQYGAVVGAALLAVGGLLALTGANIPLGLGILAAGAVTMGSTISVTWSSLKNQLSSWIQQYGSVVGGALLAVGALLAFTGANIPLGLGLLAAGAVTMGSSVSVTWTSLKTQLSGYIGQYSGVVAGASLAIGALLALSGVNIPLGLALLAAGAWGVVGAVDWEWIGNTLQEKLDALKEKYQAFKDWVDKLWETLFGSNGGNNPEPVQPSTASDPTSMSDDQIQQAYGFNLANIAGDPTMWEPIQIPVTTTPPATVAQTFKSAWDKLAQSNKEVKFIGDVVKKTGFELGNVFGKTYTAVGDVLAKAGFTLGKVFGVDLTVLGTLKPKDEKQKPSAVFAVANVLGFLGSLTRKDDNQRPSIVFGSGSNFGYTGTISRKDGSKTPGEVFNSGSNFGYTSTLARKDGAKSPAEVWNAGGSLGAYVSTLARKDGAKKPSEVWGAGESIGKYFSTLARDKKAKKPKEVWNAGSNFGYTGTLAQKNKNQKPSKVFSAGSTFSYTGTLIKGWGNKTPQKALGLTGLTTTITANFAKGKNDTVSVSGSGGTWKLAVKELGGIFANGIWSAIPQFASGTLNAGSMFIAGEAGPELVGHVGGRTEVLNKSQLASAMYSAVHSAMSGVTLDANVYSESREGNGDMNALMELVRRGYEATERQNELLRQQNDYLRSIDSKDFNPEITAASINRAQTRMNRRAGTTIVPVGT